jgi:hypothetical protein
VADAISASTPNTPAMGVATINILEINLFRTVTSLRPGATVRYFAIYLNPHQDV